jgi:inorganic pyrophosphatase/exopolyphosphatase
VLQSDPDAKICLVDHQQTSQMNPAINPDNVVGVIDHHALQSKTIVTDRPIYIDIRPWGSMSTIVAHTFLTHQRRPDVKVAGMLLCAILSDTLNLQGPTTTEWDRLMVAVLSEIAAVDDIQFLATQQFKAKSRELAGLSAHGLVNGDQKSFSFKTESFDGDVGFAVVETTDDAVIVDRLDELLPEIVACKKEKGLTALFLAVVNIVSLKGTLLLCGPTEQSLAEAAFLDCAVNEGSTMMDLGKRVSRKKDYIPAITKAIKGGWSKPMIRGKSTVDIASLGKLEVDPLDPHQRVVRQGSVLQVKKGESFKVVG